MMFVNVKNSVSGVYLNVSKKCYAYLSELCQNNAIDYNENALAVFPSYSR